MERCNSLNNGDRFGLPKLQRGAWVERRDERCGFANTVDRLDHAIRGSSERVKPLRANRDIRVDVVLHLVRGTLNGYQSRPESVLNLRTEPCEFRLSAGQWLEDLLRRAVNLPHPVQRSVKVLLADNADHCLNLLRRQRVEHLQHAIKLRRALDVHQGVD